MDRHRFVRLAGLAFAFVLLGFLARGFGRLVLPYEVAVALSAPFHLAAFALVVVLLAAGLLDLTGVRPIEE